MEDGLFTPESQSGSPAESEKSLSRSISKIISTLESPSTQPNTPLSSVLKDVVAFVDVHSTFENRSKAVANQLVQLGATVTPKFTSDVTHVIFRNGKKSIQDKAKKKGVPLLSALWIEACKKNGCRVPEDDYPAAALETSDLPSALTRLRRNRSMQPKDFEDELANSAKKVLRRRKRFERKHCLGTPDAGVQLNNGQFFVAETQPMSPACLLGSYNISIPETPPSMRRKLESLGRRRSISGLANTSAPGISIQESPPVTPVSKRLFNGSDMATPTDTPSSNRSDIEQSAEVVPLVSLNQSTDPVIEGLKHDAEQEMCVKNKRKLSTPKHLILDSASAKIMPGTECQSRLMQDEVVNIKSGARDVDLRELESSLQKSAKNTTSQTSASVNNVVARRPGKRKLLKLDEQPSQKLLSPALSQNCVSGKVSHWQFPEPKDPAKGSNVIILPHGCKHKVHASRKRKARHSSGNTSQKCSESGFAPDEANSRTKESSEERESIKRRRKSASCKPCSWSVQGSTRRQSCMPSVGSQGEAQKSHAISINDSHSKCTKAAVKAGALLKECHENNVEKLLPKQDPITDKKPRRRKSLFPRKSPVKSTVTLVQRRCHSQSGPDVSTNAAQVDNMMLMPGSSTNEQHDITCDKLNTSPAGGSSSASAFSSSHSLSRSSSFMTSRRSVDEFCLSDHKRCKIKLVSLSSALDSSGSEECRKPSSELKTVKKRRKKCSVSHCSRSGSDGSCSGSGKDNSSKRQQDHVRRSLVMTSLHSDEQDIVRCVVKKLGMFSIEHRVSSKTTHVICGNNRRTLNILLAISSGCWILSLEWVLKSLEAGRWLPEEPFEQKEYFPAAQASRLARMNVGDSAPYKFSIFSDKDVFFVAENTVPRKEDLIDLLRRCGGRVTQCARKAQVCIGNSSRPNTVRVSEKWMLDSITCHRQLPFDDYIL